MSKPPPISETKLFNELTEQQQRQTILNLRIAGWSHAQIGDAVGLSRTQVSTFIAAELFATRKLADQALEDLRTLELARLDDALKALWPRVLSADTRAVDVYLKISERRAKLTGMDAPERQVTLDLTDQIGRLTPAELASEAARLGLPLPDDSPALNLLPLPGEKVPALDTDNGA
jgi:hypothetical protein